MSEVPLYRPGQVAGYGLIRTSVPEEFDLYLRLIDSCITQLKAQGPSRTCNESKKEEEDSISHKELEPFLKSLG